MKTFLVSYETRKNGAIGEFSPVWFTVEIHQASFSDADIYRAAREQAYAADLEVRFPVDLLEVKE